MFGERPTIVIIDELASHLRQLVSSGDPETRRMAEAIPAFLKNLFELAAASPKVVVIITLATTANAFGRETDELAAILTRPRLSTRGTRRHAEHRRPGGNDRAPGRGRRDRRDPQAAAVRAIDHAGCGDAGAAYRELYQRACSQARSCPAAPTPQPHTATRSQGSYPFHPELIRVLDKRIGTIASFQRARGALRLLAEVVAGHLARQNGSAA